MTTQPALDFGAFIAAAEAQPLAGPGEEIDLCAGPGGWDVGNLILGRAGMTGVEINDDACTIARAAGFKRIKRDILTANPKSHRGVRGCVSSTPCPTFSRGGKRSGLEEIADLLDVQTCFGLGYRSEYDLEEMGLDSEDEIQVGCGCMYENLDEMVSDPRTRLFIENIRWALTAPDLEWLAMEEVATCETLFEDIAVELYSAGWQSVNVVVLDAADYGVASKRERVFLYARRYDTCKFSPHLDTPIEKTTMAEALGWPEGVKVYTRGNRTTSGGNAYSADKPSWCLTKTSRSWKIGAPDGPELTAGQAGLLNGFPPDYPWMQPGVSRTSQFQRIADVVSPVLGAVILGCATNTAWEQPVRDYLDALYSPQSRLKAWAA